MSNQLYYHYNLSTRVFTHTSVADLDPVTVEPLPVHDALLTSLPNLNEHETVKALNEEWVVIPDYRGYKYWTPSTRLIEISEVEVIPPDNAIELNDGDELIKNGDTWRLKTDADRLVEAKNYARKKVIQFATDCRAKVTSYADQYKLAGWAIKAERAARVINGTGAAEDIAILQLECDKRGKQETPEQLAQKQVEKSLLLANAVSVIDGMEDAALTAIETKQKLNTLADLLVSLESQAEIELNNLLANT